MRRMLFPALLVLAALAACGPQPAAAPTRPPTAQASAVATMAQPAPTPAQAAAPVASPTPLPALPASAQPYTPLHYDDFSQIGGGWTILRVDAQAGAEGYSGEGFAFSTSSPDQLRYDVLPSLAFAPTRYVVDVEAVEGQGVFGLMLEVRGDPADYASLAYYGAGLTMSGDAVIFVKPVAGDITVLQIAQGATPPLEPGQVLRLSVERRADQLTLAVGGNAVLIAPAEAPAGGSVGMFARATDRLAVRFDNLLLSAAAPGDGPACAGIRALFTSEGAEAISGEDVRIAQRRLARLGYVSGSAGSYDAQTATAVAQFQSRSGLPADGALGAQTWCALLSGEAMLAARDQSERAAGRERYRPVNILPQAGLPGPLLLSVRDTDARWQIALALPGLHNVHYIDTGGDALDPAWLPERGMLAFSSTRAGDGLSAVWLLDTVSGQARQVSPAGLSSEFPAWLPGGDTLMFTVTSQVDRKRVAANYIYRLGAGQARQWSSEQAGWADWSRFGTVIFTGLTGRSFDIFVADADGSNVVNLTNTDDYHEDIAAWSPDGDMIAFVRNPTANYNDRQVYVMQADGSEVRQLTALPGASSNPVWLNETTIAFVNQPSDDLRQLYLVQLSGEVRQLSANEGRVWFIGRFALP